MTKRWFRRWGRYYLGRERYKQFAHRRRPKFPLHKWFPQRSPLHKWFQVKLHFPNTFMRLQWFLFKAMFKLKIITSWWSIIPITSLVCIYKYCRNIYRDNNNDTEVLFWKLYVHFVHDWNNVSKHYIWKCIKFSTFCNKIEN